MYLTLIIIHTYNPDSRSRQLSKKSKSHTKPSASTGFIQFLKQNSELSPYLEQVQKFSHNVEKKLSLDACVADLQLNLHHLKTRAFLGLQTQRLVATYTSKDELQTSWEKFQHILGQDIVVSDSARQRLDPHCKSELDYSSVINHYKKWILQLLFLLIFFHQSENFLYPDDFIEKYLMFIHDIEAAHSSSQVKMRSAAKIDADIVFELPRHSILYVHHHLSSSHWAYVTAPECQCSGYIPVAYIKSEK